MKYIFDFDDTLLDQKRFKQHIFSMINGKTGIPAGEVEAEYLRVRGGLFSLKSFISDILARENIENVDVKELYEEIMLGCPNFVNQELLEIVKNLGKDNCYIVTYGEYEFNKDKVERSNASQFFCEVHVVSGSKKEVIEDICKQNINEKVIFIDDKQQFFNDLNFKKYPNLNTVLYTGQNNDEILSFVS